MSIDTICLLKAIGVVVLSIAAFALAIFLVVSATILIGEWVERRPAWVRRVWAILGWTVFGVFLFGWIAVFVAGAYQDLCK